MYVEIKQLKSLFMKALNLCIHGMLNIILHQNGGGREGGAGKEKEEEDIFQTY